MRPLSASLVDTPASSSGRQHLPSAFIFATARPRPVIRARNGVFYAHRLTRCNASQNGSSNGVHPSTNPEEAPGKDVPLVWTKFVAETLLPTGQGKFRLRGYRHTVRCQACGPCRLPIDHPFPILTPSLSLPTHRSMAAARLLNPAPSSAAL